MEAHMRLIIATSNEDKVREIDEILEGLRPFP